VAAESVDRLQEINMHEITITVSLISGEKLNIVCLLTCPEIGSTTSPSVLSPTTSASLWSGLSDIC
jgi:hypothetical protein